MPTADDTVEDFEQLFDSWTSVPTADDDDTECSICLDTLASHGSDKAVKTACQHIFGAQCITRWALENRAQGIIPSCPACRVIFVGPRPRSSNQEARPWLSQELEAWFPGIESGNDLDDAHIDWISKPEELWEALATRIKDALDSHEHVSRVEDAFVERFLGDMEEIETNFSCNGVWAFYMGWNDRSENWSISDASTPVLSALADLYRHFRIIPPELTLEAWGGYEALNGPPDPHNRYAVLFSQAHRALYARIRRTNEGSGRNWTS